jgi:hypothetical protein
MEGLFQFLVLEKINKKKLSRKEKLEEEAQMLINKQ